MLQRLFQRAAGKTNGSREASRPLPVAIPVPPSPPREPAPAAAPFEAASSQRLAAPPAPIAAAGDVDWQPLPGGDAIGTGRVSVNSGPAQPFPGWQAWEGSAPATDEPCDGGDHGYTTEPEEALPDWAVAYRELDAREQELTGRIEDLAMRGTAGTLSDRDRTLLEQLCQERAGVLLQKLETDPVQTVLPDRLDDTETGDWFFREATAAPPPRPPEPAPVPIPPPAPAVPLMHFGFGVGPLEEGPAAPPPMPPKPAVPVRSAARPAPAVPPKSAKSFRRRVG